MIHTRVCDLFGIDHPILLGGMGGVAAAGLAAAVSNAGGLGTLGLAGMRTERITAEIAATRAGTERPFAVNFLVFIMAEEAFEAALAAAPPVMAFAWARPDQPLAEIFARAHDAGAKVMYMAADVPMARRAAAAGADLIVAQGTEGGGHVGWMAALPLVPMVVDAVAPLPVVAAGGIADGRGMAAALALGAEGVLLGTRMLATTDSPLPAAFKQAILDSDGHDTLLSEIPDLAAGMVWPGAMARTLRNRMIERWAGREWELRARREEARAALGEARRSENADEAVLYMGQDAGLINTLPRAGEVVRGIADEAEAILAGRLPGLIRRA